jgi:hypothetical protein
VIFFTQRTELPRWFRNLRHIRACMLAVLANRIEAVFVTINNTCAVAAVAPLQLCP